MPRGSVLELLTQKTRWIREPGCLCFPLILVSVEKYWSLPMPTVVGRVIGGIYASVCLCVGLFFYTISQKPMQLGMPHFLHWWSCQYPCCIMRVVCFICSDLLHIESNCRTPEKMALALLDYLFDRDTQACSNLSGLGRHGKKKLDPLFIYGLRCQFLLLIFCDILLFRM